MNIESLQEQLSKDYLNNKYGQIYGFESSQIGRVNLFHFVHGICDVNYTTGFECRYAWFNVLECSKVFFEK